MKKYLYILPLVLFAIFGVHQTHAAVLYQTGQSAYIIQPSAEQNYVHFPATEHGGFKHIVFYAYNSNFGQPGYQQSAVQIQPQLRFFCGGYGAIISPNSVDVTTFGSMTKIDLDFNNVFHDQYGLNPGDSLPGSMTWANPDWSLKFECLQWVMIYGNNNRGLANISASDTNNYIDQSTGFQVNSQYGSKVPYIQFTDGVTIPPLAILTPLNGTSVAPNPLYVISGTCPNVGTNKLAFARDITDQQFTPTFNLECKSDHTFSFQKSIDSYLTHFYVVDQTDGSFVLTSYSVSESANQNTIKILYPTTQQDGYYTVQSSTTFPFRFQYHFQTSAHTSNVYYHLKQCTSQAYSSCATLVSENLIDQSVNYFDVNVPIGLGTEQYYRLETTGFNNTPGYISIQFTTKGTNNSTDPAPTIPPSLQGCTNFFCDLFIPRSGYVDNSFGDFKDYVSTKVPFYYFTNLQGSFAGVSTSTATGYLVDTNFSISGGNGTTTIPFRFLDTGATQNKSIFDSFRVYIEAGLWLFFAFYIFTRAFRLFRPCLLYTLDAAEER